MVAATHTISTVSGSNITFVRKSKKDQTQNHDYFKFNGIGN